MLGVGPGAAGAENGYCLSDLRKHLEPFDNFRHDPENPPGVFAGKIIPLEQLILAHLSSPCPQGHTRANPPRGGTGANPISARRLQARGATIVMVSARRFLALQSPPLHTPSRLIHAL